MSLYDALFDFFQRLIFIDSETADELWSMQFQLAHYFDGNGEHYTTISLGNWLCHTATIISITIIVVIMCMFVYKLVRIVGGLFR